MAPIYDSDGTTSHQISKIYDSDGTTNRQISKIYDNDGTINRLIYSAEETKSFSTSVGMLVSSTGSNWVTNGISIPIREQFTIDKIEWWNPIYVTTNVTVKVNNTQVFFQDITTGYGAQMTYSNIGRYTSNTTSNTIHIDIGGRASPGSYSSEPVVTCTITYTLL